MPAARERVISRSLKPTRHTEATRKAILEAAGQLFLERKVDGFSVQEVAERAGLTNRTIYRYFPTRQELMHATVRHLVPDITDDSLGEALTVGDWMDALGAHLARAEANFEIIRGLLLAMLASDEPQESDQPLRDRENHRWEVFRRRFPHLPEAEARRTFTSLRHLTSSGSYVLVRLRFGMSPAEAIETIRWGAAQIAEQAAIRDRAANRGRSKR